MNRSRSHSALVFVLGATAAVVSGCGNPPTALPPPESPTVAVTKPKVIPLRAIREFTGRLVTKDPVKVTINVRYARDVD